jgi:hypothetical protein
VYLDWRKSLIFFGGKKTKRSFFPASWSSWVLIPTTEAIGVRMAKAGKESELDVDRYLNKEDYTFIRVRFDYCQSRKQVKSSGVKINLLHS